MEAVTDAAGPDFKKAFQTAKNHNPDQAKVLSGRKVPCPKIICIPWKAKNLPGLSLENSVRNFVTTAMNLATRETCATLAFPALGKQNFQVYNTMDIRLITKESSDEDVSSRFYMNYHWSVFCSIQDVVRSNATRES